MKVHEQERGLWSPRQLLSLQLWVDHPRDCEGQPLPIRPQNGHLPAPTRPPCALCPAAPSPLSQASDPPSVSSPVNPICPGVCLSPQPHSRGLQFKLVSHGGDEAGLKEEGEWAAGRGDRMGWWRNSTGNGLKEGVSVSMAHTLDGLPRRLEGWGGAETQRGEFTLGVDSFQCMLGDLPHPEGTREPLKVSE